MRGLTFTSSGRRQGSPQPLPLRSTRHRPPLGSPPALAGRLEGNTMKLPSGDTAGSWSYHCPENGAISGLDQWPFTLWEITMVELEPLAMSNTAVSPSGVMLKQSSLAVPEMAPGANISGVTLTV